MEPLTMAALFGGGGLLKSLLVDKPREDRERALAAATQRFSPWTGLKADPVKLADPLGSAVNFGMTGAAFSQNMADAEAKKKLNDALTNRLNGGGSLSGYGPTTAIENPYDEMVHSVPLRKNPWSVSTFE